MRRSIFAIVITLIASSAAGADTKYTARKDIEDKFIAKFGNLAKRVWSEDQTVLRMMAGPTKPIEGAAKSPLVVKDVLAEFLRIDPKDLRFASDDRCATPSGVVQHQFQQTLNGFAVENARVTADVTQDNRIVGVFNRTVPNLRFIPDAPQISAEAAKCFAIATFLGVAANCDVDPRIEVPEDAALESEVTKILYPVEPLARWAWAVELSSRPRGAARRYVIDAAHGFVLETRNRVHNAGPRARVFDPNPFTDSLVTSHENVILADPPYKTVTLSRLKPPVSGKRTLSGDYAVLVDKFTDVSFPNENVESSGDFEFERGSCGFASAMAYHYITKMQDYVQSLALKGIFDRPIEVDVRHTPTSFESQYWNTPVGDGEILFGYRHADGKVFHAEDGEVIAHEYGHALQSSQALGSYDLEGTKAEETRAMYEGFGDYWALNMFVQAKKDHGLPVECFGAWIKSSTGNKACTRDLDFTLTFDKFVRGAGEHQNGRIWMAALWQLREKLEREIADPLILMSHSIVPDGPSFLEGAYAIFSADTQRNGAGNYDVICDVFVSRKLFADRTGCPLKPLVP